jgi:hypothetical protein
MRYDSGMSAWSETGARAYEPAVQRVWARYERVITGSVGASTADWILELCHRTLTQCAAVLHCNARVHVSRSQHLGEPAASQPQAVWYHGVESQLPMSVS